MTAPILVTGGTGRLGRRVVSQLLDVGCDVRVLARHRKNTPPLVAFFVGDLPRAEGIAPALTGVGAIIHCATSTKGDADATANLVTAASQTGSPHVVLPSIVGIDRLASWGYPKAKLEAERIVESGGLPWTVLRVTQFYDYCLSNARKVATFPIAPVPAGFRVQPVDPGDVAARLIEFALGEPGGRADMAGPQESSWADLLRDYLAVSHRNRWVIPIRIPGTRAVRNGALLPSTGHTVGTKTWHQFLSAQLHEPGETETS